MNCTEVQELLSAYYDGELDNGQRSRVANHLDKCSACTLQLVGFTELSTMAGNLTSPSPPKHLWAQLEQSLNSPTTSDHLVHRETETRRWSLPVPRLLAIAATILVMSWLGWLTYQSWDGHAGHDQFTVDFGHYLDEFQRNPDAAQQILLTKYENQQVSPGQAVQLVGYRPAISNALPEGYTLVSTHVLKMPCCTCVQTICKRSDGSTLAVFEHDDEETKAWFGNRSESMAECNEKQCRLIALDSQIAASWNRGTRHITLIGARDVAEVGQMVGWLEADNRSIPN